MNELSHIVDVNSGVSQSSHLAPLLFKLFIIDLRQVTYFSSICMYADDIKICFSCSDWYLHSHLQFDLSEFQKWCYSNLLFLNHAKCKLMTFYRSSPHLDSYSLGNHNIDFGVLFDHRLCFNSHITSMVNKAKGVLAFLKR